MLVLNTEVNPRKANAHGNNFLAIHQRASLVATVVAVGMLGTAAQHDNESTRTVVKQTIELLDESGCVSSSTSSCSLHFFTQMTKSMVALVVAGYGLVSSTQNDGPWRGRTE